MRKILVSSLLAASCVFGFEEFDNAVKDINSTLANMPGLYIGSLIEPRSGAVVGYAGCDDSGYYMNFNVINTYTRYTDNITIYPNIPGKNEACAIVNSADKTEVITQINSNGKLINYGTPEYNGGDECVSQFLNVTNSKENVTITVGNKVCEGILPFDPFRAKAYLTKFQPGMHTATYFNGHYKAILDWNANNSDKINALWLDRDSDSRYKYTTKEIKELALNSKVFGREVDQDGVLLYETNIFSDKPGIRIGNKVIDITEDDFNKHPALKAAFNGYVKTIGNNSSRYALGCEESASIAEGSDSLPTNYAYIIVDGKAVFKTPVPNGASKGQSPYVCNAADKGRELNRKQYLVLKDAGILVAKPVQIDENRKSAIDDEHTEKVQDKVQDTTVNVNAVPRAEEVIDNSPKGKIISLLKKATIPGTKIDEKGRFLGDVSGSGKGSAIIALPNEEEIEFTPNENFNKLAADYKDYWKEMDGAYFYACDVPTMEKADKNSPLMGYVYVIYNGHAVHSFPAWTNKGFKCDQSLINKELTRDQYLKVLEVSGSKFKSHPAVAKKM
jgi:hypothetical protein